MQLWYAIYIARLVCKSWHLTFITQSDFVAEGSLTPTHELPTNTSQTAIYGSNTPRPIISLPRSDTMETGMTRSRRSWLMALGSKPFGHASTTSLNWSVTLNRVDYLEYTLERFCAEIRRSTTLPKVEIVQVERYYQKTLLTRHRFLVLQLRLPNKSKDIFLRLDRRPAAESGAWALLSTSGVTQANDCVCHFTSRHFPLRDKQSNILLLGLPRCR